MTSVTERTFDSLDVSAASDELKDLSVEKSDSSRANRAASWFRFRSSSRSTKQDVSPPTTIEPSRSFDADPKLKESFQQMLKMTLELVDDMSLNIRPGDKVLTTYGVGTLLKKEINSAEESAKNGVLSGCGSTTRVQVKLDWGVLYCPQSDLMHKIMSPKEYQDAMDHLEEVRRLNVSIQCHDWGIEPQSEESCVACLFQKPELYASKRRKAYFRSSSSSSNKANTKTQRCDVCGNPVCQYHKIDMGGGDVEYFTMCVDCSHDLNQAEHNFHAHHPQLLQNIERLVQYYTRMSLQLCFCIPLFKELCEQLTHRQKRDGAVSLGNSTIGFCGAALGVAGAAAMLTPVGHALLLAAVATSATSGTFQGIHASYNKFWSNKTAHRLADRCLGWHGLCLGILNALETLRMDLIAQEHDFVKDHQGSARRGYSMEGSQQHSMEIWNTLAVGSFTTTRNAMTGIGVTSSLGASYSQAINTSLQGIPVVGAAFAVGCLAMDANNMASSFNLLNTPAKKAVALRGVEQSFHRHVVKTIRPNVEMIKQAVDDLQIRMAEQQRDEEAALIEAELQDLGDGVMDDDEIEKELANM